MKKTTNAATKEKNMKKTTNAELAAAFTAAKKYLSPTDVVHGAEQYTKIFICHCLDSVALNGDIPASHAFAAKKIIGTRLDGTGALECWLTYRCGVHQFSIYNAPGAVEKLQRTRLAWLNSLIAEFSEPE